MTETFPVLALAIYSDWQAREYGEPLVEPCDHQTRLRIWGAEHVELSGRRSEAARLVNRGARLRDVAGAMNIPVALRRVQPGVAHWVQDVFCRHPELVAFMPATTWQQRIWLLLVNWVDKKVDADFAVRAARHVSEIPGRNCLTVCNFLSDIADWACPFKGAGREFITRPFVSSMSLKTAIELSADWHEAVASNLEGPNAAFPAPWLPPAKIGDYEILPIEDAAALYREGHAMHHCAGTYRDRVLSGELYVYSIRRNGERTATLALHRYNNRATITQLRGACNSEPPKAITAMVLRWLRAQQPLPMRQEFLSHPILDEGSSGMKKPVPITDAEAFDSSRWTHKHDDLVKHIIDQIGHPNQHLDAIAHELAVQIGSDAQLCASLLERYSQQYLDDCTKHRTETARQMVQSFIRRAKITPGGQSMPKIRSSSELPDDEGRVFVTYMPDAPFHVMGRRADSGELFVTGIVPKEKITTEHLEHVFRIEVVTGREAEDLIAALVSEGKACGVMPAFVFERRRDIELETGLILAGDLLVYILDGAESAEDCQQISKHIIQRLIKKAKSTQMADNGLRRWLARG